jgi:UDP-2,3-diacylglucosamine pyrophosphatase LpxH
MGLKPHFSQVVMFPVDKLYRLCLCILDELSCGSMTELTKNKSFDGNASGYVTSDLHIFGCASLWDRYSSDFHIAASKHPVVVLNGDTFDFKRSRFISSSVTAGHAITLLTEICTKHPTTNFYYLLGNHDNNSAFTEILQRVAPTHKNLALFTDTLRLGRCIFLHGDAIDLPHEATDLYLVRKKYQHCEPSFLSRVFAELVTRSRINKIDYLKHTRKELAEKIFQYLEKTQPNILKDAKEIFFGHTHIPFSNFLHRGLSFHNTGSMIRGLKWNPMEFAITPPPSPIL